MTELMQAMRNEDAAERLKELRRIKEAYPDSTSSGLIIGVLLEEESKNCESLEAVLIIQGGIINSTTKAQDRFQTMLAAVDSLINHPKVAEFPKPDLLKAIQGYRAEGLKLLNGTELLETIPQQVRGQMHDSLKNMFEVPLASAQLMNGAGADALKTLEAYSKSGGAIGAGYHKVLGDAYLDQKRPKEALDAYIEVLSENGDDEETLKKASDTYAKQNKGKNDFEDVLLSRQAQLPFHPTAFAPPADWSGKTVLAELFTGSECPPCVGADLGFDGLLESYPTKYLAILEYHLPIPRADPMMNPATKQMADFYEIRSTPTVVIDGNKLPPGGGGKPASESLYGKYKEEIDPRIAATPPLTISASARLDKKGILTVECESSKPIPDAQLRVVLVQTEEKFKGGNGIIFHKMVVRDMETVAATEKATITFNLAESEKKTDAYLTEYEKTNTRGHKFTVRHHKIDREKLKVVVFVQEPSTKQVYNSHVTDVEPNKG
jgi:thiol-disulfide isomerase/thioredoxin